MFKKVDFRKGTGTFVLGYMIMLLTLVVTLVLIEQYSKYMNALDTQMAADSISDGTAVYASSVRGVSADDLYTQSLDRAEDLTDLIQSETNVQSIVGAYIDEDQFNEDDVVYIEILARYLETSNIDAMGYSSNNDANNYEILRTSATKFQRNTVTGDYVWPIDNNYITSAFGPRVISGGSSNHRGVDIADSGVGTPFYCVADGTVVMLHRPDGCNSIVIEHGTDENGDTVYSMYKHGDCLPSLQIGQHVSQGQMIGTSNMHGASASHLHLDFFTTSNIAMSYDYIYHNALTYGYKLSYDGVLDGSMSCTLQKYDGTFINTLIAANGNSAREDKWFRYNHCRGASDFY